MALDAVLGLCNPGVGPHPCVLQTWAGASKLEREGPWQPGRGAGVCPGPAGLVLAPRPGQGPCGAYSAPDLTFCWVGGQTCPTGPHSLVQAKLDVHPLPVFLAAGCDHETQFWPMRCEHKCWAEHWLVVPSPGKSSLCPLHFSLLLPEQRCDGRGNGSHLNHEATLRQEAMCKEVEQKDRGARVSDGPALVATSSSHLRDALLLAVVSCAGVFSGACGQQFPLSWEPGRIHPTRKQPLRRPLAAHPLVVTGPDLGGRQAGHSLPRLLGAPLLPPARAQVWVSPVWVQVFIVLTRGPLG